ncbi:MAG: PAS domain S-box protein [Balneolaceae bacterium]|nr:PAS domain S-box protein [Balneolaceae bacterium]
MDNFKLHLNSDLFRSAIELMPAAIVISNPDGNIVYVNKFFSKLTGYSFEEVRGGNPGILESNYQPLTFYKDLWATISSGKTWSGDLMNKKKNGDPYWERATIQPVFDDTGSITHYISVKQDITEEKLKETETARRERILNDIETLSKTGGWEYDVGTEQMFWTDELYHLHGLDPKQDWDHIAKSLQCYVPDDRQIVENSFNECLKNGKDYDLTVRFRDLNGKHKWIRTKSRALLDDDGKVVKIIGSVRDVSEEVDLEQALIQKESRFREVINAFDDIVFTLDKDGRHTELFGKWAENVEMRNLLLGKKASEIMGTEAAANHIEAFNKAINGNSVVYLWSIQSNEIITNYQTKLTPITSGNGNITGVLGVGRNISSEVRFQEALKAAKDRLNYSLEGTQAGTWDWNIKSGEVIYNEQWAKMLGYTLAELEPHTLKTWENLTHPDDLVIAHTNIERVLKGKDNFFESRFRMKHKKGHWVWIQDRGKAFRSENGEPIRMAGTHVDITKEMEAELAVIASEKRYKDLFTRSADANLLVRNNKIIDCNKAAYTMLGYTKKEDLIGKSPTAISPKVQPNGKLSKQAHVENLKNLNHKNSIKFEWYHQKKDMSLIPVEIVVTRIRDVDGDDIGYVVWRDITTRIKAEEQIKEALNEKNVLLSEIHHRVKNNLAVISGLLQLQAYNLKDSESADMINSSINRIKSIALIHEQLYKSTSFSNISLKENIQKQAEGILETFSSTDTTDISLKLDLEEMSININQALPLGLLVNEILTNSLKHAFHNRSQGIISIKLHQTEQYIELFIADDGPGFNEAEISSDSLGRSLIDTFVQQLEGDLELNSKNGTSYTIRFKKREIKGVVASNYI